MTAKLRIHLTLDKEGIRRFKHLMESAGLPTRRDVINHAIAIMEIVVNELKDGRVMYSLDEKENFLKKIVFVDLSCQTGTDAEKPTKH